MKPKLESGPDPTGILPMQQIVRAALSAGAKHLFIEQDTSADPLASIAVSWRFLKGLATTSP